MIDRDLDRVLIGGTDLLHQDIFRPNGSDRSSIAVDSGRIRFETGSADFDLSRRRDLCWDEIHLANKVGDKDTRRVGIDVDWRADLLDPSLAHNHHLIGESQRFFLVMGHHDRGDAKLTLEILELATQLNAHFGIEGRKRLVEQEQTR